MSDTFERYCHGLPNVVPNRPGEFIKLLSEGRTPLKERGWKNWQPGDGFLLDHLRRLYGHTPFPRGNLDAGRLNRLFGREILAIEANYDPRSPETLLRLADYLRAATANEIEVEAISRPASALGQGFRLSVVDRIAIERRAMVLAEQWLESQGFVVVDRSRYSSFDLEASKDGTVFKIEVKGTTTADDGAIFMTKNEVDLHTADVGNTGLIIVSEIQLHAIEGKTEAMGGCVRAELPWDIGCWEKVPVAFRLTRPKPATAD